MELPVMPPVSPMLAKSVSGVPAADSVAGGLGYEPKWDGFRCIAFRDGDEVVLGSRNEKTLTRYFPEVVTALQAALPDKAVVDGEIVIRNDNHLDFVALTNRIHPADSRVQKLAVETPAEFVAFDVLAIGNESLMTTPYIERRGALDRAISAKAKSVHVTPMTRDLETAKEWFERFEGAGLDGIVAKPLNGRYEPDKRAMLKIKHERTADVVVAAYREHKTSTASRPLLGSLVLGLYDDDGALHHVGVSASFSTAVRASLIKELEPLHLADGEAHPWLLDSPTDADHDRIPGGVNRWNAKKDLSFVPLRIERVAEVAYDHMEGQRFRHTTQFKRWRPDREPSSCTFDQLERPVTFDLGEVLTSR